jgi:hypothetical protein
MGESSHDSSRTSSLPEEERLASGGTAAPGELQPQPPPAVPQQLKVELPSRPILERLLGMDPSDILPKITEGDPLGVHTLCMRRLRERALILDPTRALERALIEIAFDASMSGPEDVHSDFLQRAVDRALSWLLTFDAEAERESGGKPPRDTTPYHFVYDAFGATKDDARRATVAFHALPLRTRRAFFVLLVDAYPVEECLALGLWKEKELQMDIWVCMQALGHVTVEETEEYWRKWS